MVIVPSDRDLIQILRQLPKQTASVLRTHRHNWDCLRVNTAMVAMAVDHTRKNQLLP